MSERPAYQPTRLRAWRKYRDFTQEELAEKMGVSPAAISMIERGKRGYDQEFLEAAAAVLATTPEAILRVDPLTPNRTELLVEKLRQIPEADLARVQKVLEAFTPPDETDPQPPISPPSPTKPRGPKKRK